MSTFSLTIIWLYVILFIWQCIRHQAWRWLAITAAIAIAAMLAVLWSMPVYLWLTGSAFWSRINLYLMQVYILIGSWTYIGRNRLHHTGSYLYYLARSSWLQYLAVVLWLGLLLISAHQPWQIPIGISVLNMVFWQPLFWLGGQWLLMLFLYLRDHDAALPLYWRKNSMFIWVVLWQALYLLFSVRGWI